MGRPALPESLGVSRENKQMGSGQLRSYMLPPTGFYQTCTHVHLHTYTCTWAHTHTPATYLRTHLHTCTCHTQLHTHLPRAHWPPACPTALRKSRKPTQLTGGKIKAPDFHLSRK